MGKKHKDDDRVADLFKAAEQAGSTKNLMSDVVGMPDSLDEEFIRKLIAVYEKATGGLLRFTITQARAEFDALNAHKSTFNDEAVVSKDSNMTYDFELPLDFYQLVEKYYPTMFRDRRHFRWFKRKLPGLMIRPNTKKADRRVGL